MITVSIAGNTPAEVAKQASEVAALLSGSAPKPAAAAAPAAPAPKAPAPKAPAPKAPAPKAPALAEGGVTLQSLRDKGRACIKAGKNDEMKAALTELGSDSITTLDPSKYGELDAKLDAILNPEVGTEGNDAL